MQPSLTEQDQPRSVSIVMPVLNGMPWIADAVASVMGQEGVEVELIVLDGGSTDGTREWLADAALREARVILAPDLGQSDAISKGLAVAGGAVLGWLNADDLLEPGALATVLAAFASHPGAPAVSGACSTIDEDGMVTGRIDPPPDGSLVGLLGYPRNLAQPATFFTADAYRRTTGLDPRLHYAMDVDLWLKLARLGPFVLLPDRVLARFRIHGSAKSSRAATAMIREDLRVRRRHGMPVLGRASLTLMRWAYLRPLKLRLGRIVPGRDAVDVSDRSTRVAVEAVDLRSWGDSGNSAFTESGGRPKRPYISVVVAVRNGAATLQRCLDSVFDQAFEEWELIVIDGGSSDGTQDILERNARRIHYSVSEPDRGIYHAWNKALPETRGAWLCFLGADDRLHRPDVLQRMAGRLMAAEGSFRVVYGSVNVVDASGLVLSTVGLPWPAVRGEFLDHMAVPHQAVFHHRSLFDRNGRFDERYRISGDYELLLRELVEHDAMFVPDLIIADMGSGGLSDRPETRFTLAREFHHARRTHGLTRQPELLSLALWRLRSRAWLSRAFGPRVTDSVVGAYRFVARKPRQPTYRDP
jgi:glycosyltransferase involved in cell wall biosynthesis